MKVVIMPRERVVHGALSFSVGQSLLFGLATLALVLFAWAHLQRVFQPPFAENLREDPRRKSAIHPEPHTDKQALDSLFVQIGVLQANYLRLDTLSRRVAGLAGFPAVDLQIVSENAEITAALTGENRLGFAVIPRGHRAINTRGELCDRWGTPFRLHQLSGTQMEIRSAGPDRTFATGDDAFWPPPVP